MSTISTESHGFWEILSSKPFGRFIEVFFNIAGILMDLLFAGISDDKAGIKSRISLSGLKSVQTWTNKEIRLIERSTMGSGTSDFCEM